MLKRDIQRDIVLILRDHMWMYTCCWKNRKREIKIQPLH